MSELTAMQKRLAGSFVAGAVVTFSLLAATWVYMPSIDELSVTSTRSGRFSHFERGSRGLSSSTVNLSALWCSSSVGEILNTSCNFPITNRPSEGDQVSVEEVRVKTLWGSMDVVALVIRNGTVFYSKNPVNIQNNWRDRSILEAVLLGFLMANTFYIFRRL